VIYPLAGRLVAGPPPASQAPSTQSGTPVTIYYALVLI